MSQTLILILIPWLLTTPCPIVPLLHLRHLSCQLSRPIQFFWRPIPSYTCIRTSHSILVLQQTLSVTARTCSNCLLILNGQYIHFCGYFISYEQMFLSFGPERIIIFISTHAHPSSRDPWVSDEPACLNITEVHPGY